MFTYPCTIGTNQSPLTTLIDTCAKGGNFIHYQTAQILCNIVANKLSLTKLWKPIHIQGFNGRKAPNITHKLITPLKVGRYSELGCEFLVTDLGGNDLIIGNKWLKRHGAVLVPMENEIWFTGGHCEHDGAPPVIPIQ